VSDRTARDVQEASECRATARLLDSGGFGLTGKVNEVGHGMNVEDSSTAFKPKRCVSLNSVNYACWASSAVMTDVFDKRLVGRRITMVRTVKGFGLRPFARHMEVDHTKLNHWEKGTHYPDISFVAALHQRFGVTADWIYFGEIAGVPLQLAEQFRAAEKAAEEKDRAEAEASAQAAQTLEKQP